jgi:hypothetical protein
MSILICGFGLFRMFFFAFFPPRLLGPDPVSHAVETRYRRCNYFFILLKIFFFFIRIFMLTQLLNKSSE